MFYFFRNGRIRCGATGCLDERRGAYPGGHKVPVARANAKQSDRVPEGGGYHAFYRSRAHRTFVRGRTRHELVDARDGARPVALAARVPERAEP